MRENGASGTGNGIDLSPEQRRHVRFVLKLVDQLADRDGFDPAEMTDPWTGGSLASVLARMRQALAGSDAKTARSNGK